MAATLTGPLGWHATTPPDDADRALLVVVLDHAHARFFLADSARATELPCFVSPRMRGGKYHSDRQGSPGWGEAGFHGRRAEEERRHYTGIAQRLGVLTRAHRTGGVLIAGSAPVVAGMQRALPPRLVKQLVGTATLNPTEVTAAQVRTAAAGMRHPAQLAAQAELVTAAVEGFGTGRAVDGLREALQALAHDQVRTLLVAQPGARPGYRAATSGRLVLTKADALGESVIRVPDLVSAARAETERLGGSVAEIDDPQQAARIDGVAALLRYR
jgi:hypothetical protein